MDQGIMCGKGLQNSKFKENALDVLGVTSIGICSVLGITGTLEIVSESTIYELYQRLNISKWDFVSRIVSNAENMPTTFKVISSVSSICAGINLLSWAKECKKNRTNDTPGF